ncbi:Crp/Fnr family transcriptional regulator [Oscillatoria sp. FACHB-1406]|nr:Crp/Fnr family transcriptional regulator [Oscillatoria sp. FACHB-1406]
MNNRSELEVWLQTTLIFRGLSTEQLESLGKIARLQSIDKGGAIFHQGTTATGFFIVKSGRVKVFKVSPNGKEQILHIFEAQDYFAEVPAFDGKTFPASAEALEAVELIFFPRLAFLELLERYPAIAIRMLTSLSLRLRQLTQLVENLSFKEVPQRLAAYLLDLSDRANNSDTVTLDLAKGQLAAALGTIPATLSRAFYRLSNEGIIAMNGSQIELRDRDRLLQLSQASDRE